MKINKKLNVIKKWLSLFIVVAVLINPLGAVTNCAQENQPGAQESASDNISLDLKNVDIVELLRVISLKTGKTIVPSKEVVGRITVYLSNVDFNDVLDIILLTQGLALNHKGNVYYVMSEAEYRKVFGRDYVDQRKIQTVKLAYAKPSVIFTALGQLKSDVGKIVVDESSGTIILIDIPEKLELLNKAIKDLDRPLTTTVYDLNYMKAADAKAQFGAAVTQGTGEVIIDERSGKAIISDLPQKMQKMNMLVRELDEESRQVYVEADIVELTLSDEFERGVNWEKVFAAGVADGLAFSGYFPAATLSAVGATAYQRISVGTLATDKYTGILNFLDTYGKTKIISQPRIAVLNNEEATVMVGVREAYITQTQSQATSTVVTAESVEFIDVGVKLKIIPKISADGFIIMKIKPEVSSVKETITTELGSRIPIVQTAQSETVIKIKDGTMIMLAGMTKTEDVDTVKGWPVLSKIPYLGALFGYRSNSVTKTEVIIFLTPHLSSGDVALRGAGITKILPAEYLPENLQDKVARDEEVDKTIFRSELTPEDKEATIAERKTARIAARKAIEDAAEENANRMIEEATDKATGQAAKEAARQVLKDASIKAAEILQGVDRAAKEITPKDKAIKIAEKKAAGIATRQDIEEAARENAKDIIAEATEKAARKAAENAAKQILKDASIKASEILQGTDKAANAIASKDKAIKIAEKKAAEMAARKEKEDAAQENAKKIAVEAAKKAADEAAKKAAEKEASIKAAKAAEILKQATEKSASVITSEDKAARMARKIEDAVAADEAAKQALKAASIKAEKAAEMLKQKTEKAANLIISEDRAERMGARKEIDDAVAADEAARQALKAASIKAEKAAEMLDQATENAASAIIAEDKAERMATRKELEDAIVVDKAAKQVLKAALIKAAETAEMLKQEIGKPVSIVIPEDKAAIIAESKAAVEMAAKKMDDAIAADEAAKQVLKAASIKAAEILRQATEKAATLTALEDKAAGLAAKKKMDDAIAADEAAKQVLKAASIKAAKAVEILKQAVDKAAVDKAVDKSVKPSQEAEKKTEKMVEKKVVKQVVSVQVKKPAEVKKPILEETAKAYYQKGLRARTEFNNEDAKTYFNKAIELDKKFAAAYNSLGIVYEEEGNLDKAEQVYLKAVKADPEYMTVYSNLALLNEDSGNLDKALVYWRKRASNGDPNDEWTKKALQRIRELER